MGRILSIDYGRKRSGIAVTDEMKIIATGLTTVATHDLFDFLTSYIAKENVETIVVGLPKTLQNRPSESARYTEPFVKKLKKSFPFITIERIDERFTSSIAQESMRKSGIKKTQRQDKSIIDKISATIILQSYMSMKERSNQ